MDDYLLFKSIHLLGVVLFLGNIIITGWWKIMADRHGDARVVAFAQRQVTLTDYVFTAGGVILVLIGGLGNVMQSPLDFSFLDTLWLSWGFWLFNISGIIWVLILIPIQIKQAKMAKAFADGGDIPPLYHKLTMHWNIWGALAVLLPLMNLYWMVFKPYE